VTDALHDAFVEDHQVLTRGLVALRDALRGATMDQIHALADRLDQEAGPHIDFEEGAFYPALEPLLGKAPVEQLYVEHSIGRRVLLALTGLPTGAALSADERAALAAEIDATLEHALSCGTLLSELDGMEPRQRSALLEELRRCRERQRRWTQLPAHGDEAERDPGTI
jgi:hypothetical protein